MTSTAAELIAEAVSWMRADDKFPRAEAVDLIQRLSIALEEAVRPVRLVTIGTEPDVVSTVAELDALPDGSVILSHPEGVTPQSFERFDNGRWYSAGQVRDFMQLPLPARVLWVGGTE